MKIIKDASKYLIWLIPSVLIYLWWRVVTASGPLGIGRFFDTHDVGYYFDTSTWVIGNGVLYRDIVSDYPLMANLLFGFVRLLTHGLGSAGPFETLRDNFVWLWGSIIATLFFGLVLHFKKTKQTFALWVWLTPAVIHFSVMRYDFYPALLSVLTLMAFRDGKNLKACLWFSLCIALKGYGLFLMPTIFVYIWGKEGFKRAVYLSAICLSLFCFSVLIVYTWAGLDGMLMPFRFHATRVLNGETFYDVVEFAMRSLGVSSESRNAFIAEINLGIIPKVLQAAGALIAAASMPKDFKQLVSALLFALLAFASFSIFYSPQYVVWIVAIAGFSESRITVFFATLLGWATFMQAPLAGAYRFVHQKPFKNMIVAVCLCRLGMMISELRNLGRIMGQNLFQRESSKRRTY